jgi:hypothetical protein
MTGRSQAVSQRAIANRSLCPPDWP